jgi:hypothetical protein
MLHTISYSGNKIYTIDRKKGSALKIFSVSRVPDQGGFIGQNAYFHHHIP